MKSIFLFLFLTGFPSLLCGCGAHPAPATKPAGPVVAQPVESDFTPGGPGPTVMSRVPGGYELINSQFRAVISEKTGDVIFWGYADKTRNVLTQRGIYTTLSALPDTPVKGYIEQRDEDSWQFMGDDDNHITWRKIYRLAGDHLEVSIMIQNNRADPLDTAINICSDMPGIHIVHHDPEQFDAFGNFGTISIHGFNVQHNPNTQPLPPTLVQSDVLHLKPQERQSYTSMWMLSQ